ncbi:MAG: transposase [Comamonadaceae bacterium]|nr:transposase [Comamonadaceae bacterium]
MARLPRYFVPDVPLHLIQRGNNRQVIFADDEDFAYFRDCLLDAARREGLAIHAYVFMTNHVHLLATPAAEASAGRTLQSVGRRYVQHFNQRYRRTGTLWEGRYKSTVIDAEDYLIACMPLHRTQPGARRHGGPPARLPLVELPGACRRRARRPAHRPQALSAPGTGRGSRARAAYRLLFRGALGEALLAEIRDADQQGLGAGQRPLPPPDRSARQPPRRPAQGRPAAERGAGPVQRKSVLRVFRSPERFQAYWQRALFSRPAALPGF